MKLKILLICTIIAFSICGCKSSDTKDAESSAIVVTPTPVIEESPAPKEEEKLEDDTSEDTEETIVEEEMLDLPDIIDGDATEEGFSEEDVKSSFQATYRTEDIGEVTITELGNNQYNVNFGLYGKGLFEDHNAYYENYAIHFNFTTPDGNGVVNGYMEFGETLDILNVVILESDWPAIPAGTFVELEKRIEF